MERLDSFKVMKEDCPKIKNIDEMKEKRNMNQEKKK